MSSPSLLSTEVTLDFDSAPGAITASAVTSSSLGTSASVASPARHGSLRAPGDLGVRSSPSSPVRSTALLQDPVPGKRLVTGGRRRAMAAIKSASSHLVAAPSSNNLVNIKNETIHDSSLVCTVSYRGMEVLFSTVKRNEVIGVCARTRVTLQTLDLPGNGATVVRLVSNPDNGMITVAMSDGVIQTYHPVKARHRPEPNKVVSAFGKYRWRNGPKVSCRDTFHFSSQKKSEFFAFSGDDIVDISSSADYRLLVAHHEQLAIFDAKPTALSSDVLTMELIWTTTLDRAILSARISGDGSAIVLVVAGEGINNENPFGARTFIRDIEDGASVDGLATPSEALVRQASNNTAVGIVYKPGPFLVHDSSVSHVSFRGFGHVTSNLQCEGDEGNDLLLTYCESDNCVRIFSQNSWKKITQWKSPPHTRVDWVRGITSFNLGDLESRKSRKKSNSSVSSRRPSSNSAEDSRGFSAAITGTRPFQAAPIHPSPSSAGGAWIAELTFRSVFPALRLSRLSYMKRGSEDSQAAHFESVAAILPAGSVISESVLGLGEMGLSIQGIWPAWPMWNTDAGDADHNGTLNGSAMAFLGLAPGSLTPHGYFGDSITGGTHSPPSELRITASHSVTGKVILMEFPLWVDQEYGAVELGSPLRYLLSLNDAAGTRSGDLQTAKGGNPNTGGNHFFNHETVCLEYESSILSAQIDKGCKSVSITWRKQGSMSIIPASRLYGKPDFKALLSNDPVIVSSAFGSSNEPALFHDVSVIPVPLSLPTVRLPKSSDQRIVALRWWPDENYGGPPQLLVATDSGSILLFEMPPPWSALEPSMPACDPFQESASDSIPEPLGEISCQNNNHLDSDSDLEDEGDLGREYDVLITPHPDFGIGLRLEAQMEGMPSIAGSFKKNPLSDQRLPAERTGMISLGDELLSVNGVSLEGISFDDIIGTVREVSSDSNPGEPLCMRFRPSLENRRRLRNIGNSISGTESQPSDGGRERRQIIGFSKKADDNTGSQSLTVGDSLPNLQASAPDSVENGIQQEFSRIIAAVQGVVQPTQTKEEIEQLQNSFALLEWTRGAGAPATKDIRGAALLVFAHGSTLRAKRFEVPASCEPEVARCDDLGSIDLGRDGLPASGNAVTGIQLVKTAGKDSWCVSVSNRSGRIIFVFVEIEAVQNFQSKFSTDAAIKTSSLNPPLRAQFRQYHVLDLGLNNGASRFRPFSLGLAAAILDDPSNKGRITVWSTLPTARLADSECQDGDYSKSELATQITLQNEVVDFRFIVSRPLDALPLIAVFTKESVIAFRCSGAGTSWQPVLEILYSEVATSSNFNETLRSAGKGSSPSPSDLFPHLACAIRNLCEASDEFDHIKSDWHPDAILSSICTESYGAGIALQRNITPLYSWLSLWTCVDENKHPSIDMDLPHGIVPFSEIFGYSLRQAPATDKREEGTENASMLIASLSLSKSPQKPVSDKQSALSKLQLLLCPSRRLLSRPDGSGSGKRSNEFKLTMAVLPEDSDACEQEQEALLPLPLRTLTVDELRLVWALGEIVANPPNFKGIDESAQHTLICVALFRALECAKNDEESETGLQRRNGMSLQNINDQLHGSMRVKNTFSFYSVGPPPKPSIASAACIAALTSNYQVQLIESFRPQNDKFSWENARSLRLPFWVRSDEQLRKITEEIGQKEYRDTRDIMKSALFFVMVGNIRTLRNLAATDQSMTGRTFSKFINSYDFSSERGRHAAEKNAYSLLSKRKHVEAVAFFLLAEPPMTKIAIECIITKMGDLDLAFLALRMIDLIKNKNREQEVFPGGLNLSSMMGGGGGYATGGQMIPTAPPIDSTPFYNWKPNLSTGARELLKERGIPSVPQDLCFISLQLMWLGRREEASHQLSGLSPAGEISAVVFPRSFDKSVSMATTASASHFGSTHHQPDPGSANRRVITKCNEIINFSSRPLLTSLIQSSARSRWAATLVVGDALKNRGLELLSARSILQNTRESDFDEIRSSTVCDELKEKQGVSASSTPVNKDSSIFDAFEIKPPPAPPVSALKEMPSIFDSYDMPQILSHTKSICGGQTQSNILDSFFPTTQKVPSIFDAFDMPNPKPRIAVAVSDSMQSSIFDSFDVPKPKPSSNFGSFDRPTNPNDQKAGEMASSIFASFDGPVVLNPSAVPISTALDGTDHTAPKESSTATMAEESEGEQDIAPQPIPLLWRELRDCVLVVSAARRLIRELTTVVSLFHGDARDLPISIFCNYHHPLIPSRASEILRTTCNGESVVASVRSLVESLCSSFELDISLVVEQALRLLDSKAQPACIVFCVLLHSVMDRSDLAEDVVRDAAIGLIDRCEAMALANDDLVDYRQSVQHCSSQYLRRLCVRVSWQLELCLWLHRGGAIPLSSLVLKETTIAVRIGFIIASWSRNHDCLEAVIRCEPDCEIDHQYGRQLWSSMKMLSGMDNRTPKSNAIATGSSSGGWEFLVDCRREEATKMLKELSPGSFIIRPHTEDNGVFTLSFKTNLTPAVDPSDFQDSVDSETKEVSTDEATQEAKPLGNANTIKKDDVVQHAIIRLSDAGFRCGSFGPFASLLKLLEAVSASLPFDLLFDKPPVYGIMKEECAQPSPNGVFLRKFALTSHSEAMRWNRDNGQFIETTGLPADDTASDTKSRDRDQLNRLGIFCQLLTLTEIRKQLSGIAAAQDVDIPEAQRSLDAPPIAQIDRTLEEQVSVDSTAASPCINGIEEHYAVSNRILRPFLVWCRVLETLTVFDIAPSVKEISADTGKLPVTLSASETAIECAPPSSGGLIDGGDSMIRSMIQPESGVEFRTLRVGEGGDSAMIVLFSKRDAIKWLISSGKERDMDDALATLKRTEKGRVIEPIALSDLSLKSFTNQSKRGKEEEHVCYRFVDPWEVEALESREGETLGASLGREHYFSFSVSSVASSCEGSLRKLGGIHLLGLWTNSKGGIRLTKAIASVHAPWERDAGGDLQMYQGTVSEPSPFSNSIRQHLYRNDLFRRLHMPQRFMALVQVELLDLKNLNAPGGTSLSVYALLRLKRPGSSAPLSHKARTLDSSATLPVKVGKSVHAGPNAPASWGSLVRFRFPLPEDVNCDGVSLDGDREALFKGPPSMLQISVYEKKFMSDITLGGADVKLDSLTTGGQIEEWVPLRSEKHGIHWFARIRLTLRFELMCLPTQDNESATILPPSVGLRKIQQLSKMGGTHEDNKVKKSGSTQDLLTYFESMVY